MNTRKSFYDIASYYEKNAVLKASFCGMRYQVEKKKVAAPEENVVLLATVWPEPFSFEKTEDEKKNTASFSYDEKGLDDAYQWICDQFAEKKNEWEAGMENPFRSII